MSKKLLFMETTEVPPEKTAAEITALLVQNGARHIAQDYDAHGKVTALRFVLMVNGLPYPFHLPARVAAIQAVFKARRMKVTGNVYVAQQFEAKDRAAAERIGWRQLYRWLQAQFALIDTGMVKAHEVLAPYLLDGDGRTLFEHLEATKFKELPPPEEARHV